VMSMSVHISPEPHASSKFSKRVTYGRAVFLWSCIGGSRIFLEGVTLGTRASEASEHCGGLGLREKDWLEEGHKTTSK